MKTEPHLLLLSRDRKEVHMALEAEGGPAAPGNRGADTPVCSVDIRVDVRLGRFFIRVDVPLAEAASVC